MGANGESERKLLYVGVGEQVAKLAPMKGLEPPIILTDVYPGHFAFLTSPADEKWGIIEVNINVLVPDSFAPFHGYIERISRKKTEDVWSRRAKCLDDIYKHRQKWHKSLQECGSCLYLMRIPSHAITKVIIYTPFGKESNQYVTKQLANADPWNVTPSGHKAAYKRNQQMTKWLIGAAIETKNDLLNDRTGLDLFYQRAEKDVHVWWRA